MLKRIYPQCTLCTDNRQCSQCKICNYRLCIQCQTQYQSNKCPQCRQHTFKSNNNNQIILPLYLNVHINHTDSRYTRIKKILFSSQYGIMFMCMIGITYLLSIGYLISYYLFPNIINHSAYFIIMILIGFIGHTILILFLYTMKSLIRIIQSK